LPSLIFAAWIIELSGCRLLVVWWMRGDLLVLKADDVSDEV
jgi:hypothetical protein